MKDKLKKAYQKQVEKILAPRLGVIGWILLSFSLASLVYGFFVHPLADQIAKELPAEIQTLGIDADLIEPSLTASLNAEDVLNFYSISILFGVLGLFCVITSHTKQGLFDKKRYRP